jgi:hypothetical protein
VALGATPDGWDDATTPVYVDIDATPGHRALGEGPGGGTYKGGFAPIVAFADRGDGRGEPLGLLLRPGNAGAVRHEVARVEWTHRREVRLMSKV